jgi:hypothetical protein
MAPWRHDAIGCATNDPGTIHAIMAAARKVAKTCPAAASYSQMAAAVPGPPHTGHRWPVPLARAGPSQRFIGRALFQNLPQPALAVFVGDLDR